MNGKVIAKNNTVLIKPDSKDKVTKGGIIIPTTAVDKTHETGTIVDIVDIYSDNQDKTHEVRVGDKVLYKGGSAIRINEGTPDELHICQYANLLLKVDDRS